MKKYFLFLPLLMLLNNVSFCQSFDQVSNNVGVSHTLNSTVHWGAGVSFFDFDNDGWDDLTLLRHGDSAYFYRNMGGYFELLPSYVNIPGRAAQIIWVDYDNDGDNDFFLSTFGTGQCRLFNNNGNMEFTDVTEQAGLLGLNTDNYGVSFGDYDKDGDLDMYLVRYCCPGPANPNNAFVVNALFRNNGDGTFTNVAFAAGVSDGVQPSFIGVWLDYNDDTWPDLYVINDRFNWQNTMYRNNGDGTFTNVTAATNTAMVNDDPMSATFADFDNDGDNDIYSTNTGGTARPARFLIAQDDLTFTEEAVARGVNNNNWAWGATFIDVDNDTWQDLYVTTGTINTSVNAEVRNYLYMSNEGLTFTDSPQLFSNSNHIAASYSVAKGDINNDGYADMVVTNAKGFSSWVWQNSGTANNNYVKVTLEGTISNRMAIGSWIRVYAGGNTYSFYTRCGENYCSQNSQHHIFGLGQYDIIDSITVTYLSGIKDVYVELAVNQHYYFTEGETLLFSINDPDQTTICEGMSVELSAPQFVNYSWSNGATTQTISVSESGSYSLTATNSFGHVYYSDTVQVTVMNPVYVNETTTHLSCFESNNGAISLEIFNQTDIFNISWQDGQNTQNLENLAAGVYSYTYEDEFGCTFEGTVFVDQPAALQIFTEITPQTTFQLGSIQVLAIGGTPPYSYYIDGELMLINPRDSEAGDYAVSVIDQNGCELITHVTIVYIDFSGVTQFDESLIGVFPNPSLNNEIQIYGFVADDIVGLYDVSARQIEYSVKDNTLFIQTGFKGVAQLIVKKDGVQYTIRVVIL
jgi:hypothetical protein